MTGFALEARLVKWTCSCKHHVNGACQNPRSNKTEEISSAYIGSFAHNAPTKTEVLYKFDIAVKCGFEPPNFPKV